MADKIQLRGDLAAVWTLVNPILADREYGLETDTGWHKVGNGVSHWSALPYSDVGPQGIPGTNGTNGTNGTSGSVWHTGSTVPSSGLGIDGDYYFRTTTDDIFHKLAGSWGSPIANIKGAPGASGTPGSPGPAGPVADMHAFKHPFNKEDGPYYSTPSTCTTRSNEISPNVLYAAPFVISGQPALAVAVLGINVLIGGGDVATLGIYRDSRDEVAYPGDLLIQTEPIRTDTSGFMQQKDLDAVIDPGVLYWLAILTNGPFAMSHFAATSLLNVMGFNQAATGYTHIESERTYDPHLPSTFPAEARRVATITPAVFVGVKNK